MDDSAMDGGTVREQRSAPRVPLKKCATLAIANGAAMDVRTADISSGGMGVISDSPLIPGQSCLIQFEIHSDNRKILMSMRGTVVFCLFTDTEGFRIGVRASQVDPDLIQYIHCLLQ